MTQTLANKISKAMQIIGFTTAVLASAKATYDYSIVDGLYNNSPELQRLCQIERNKEYQNNNSSEYPSLDREYQEIMSNPNTKEMKMKIQKSKPFPWLSLAGTGMWMAYFGTNISDKRRVE